MALRAGHGRGATTGARGPRVEVVPADELPVGVPANAGQERQGDRGESGRFLPGNVVSRKGGHAKGEKIRLAARLGLRSLPGDNAFSDYRASAASFRRQQCAELARSVGGGFCGPATSSIVASASLQLAWSRYLSDLAAMTGDEELAIKASRLAEASRQSLLAAHEICAREAMARQKASPVNAAAVLAAQLAKRP